MKNFNFISAVLIFSCFTTEVLAASITLDTRSINAGVNSLDYKASWSAQSSAITSQSLADVNGAFGGSQAFSYLKIDFSTMASSWDFQIAPDAGFGGALYLDNQLIDHDSSNLWWGYVWSNSSELLASSANIMMAGDHVLEAFWAEDCCNGSMGGRFSVDGGKQWQNLSVANLNQFAIPSPDAAWLIALGLLALGYVKSKESDSTRAATC
ncbi:MAG: CCXG family PEP-CTERM protein [Methylococcales bacterium]